MNNRKVNLIDIVPESIKHDQEIINICATLQPELDDLSELIPLADIYGNIDILPEPMLAALAWENGVYGAEWAVAGTIEKRRELVKMSFILNRMRGTKWALMRVFSMLGLTPTITEWYKEGGDPFTFRISLLDVSNTVMTKEMGEWINDLVTAYKPMTRHITETNLFKRLAPAEIHAQTAVVLKQHFTV